MPAPPDRPPAAGLAYSLFDRALPPDALPALAERSVRRGDFVLTVRITPFGHAAEWKRGGLTVTELVAPSEWDLPLAGRLLGHRFPGGRTARRDVGGVSVSVSLQAEELPPEQFVALHDELAADGARRGLLFHFKPRHRLGLAPLGWVSADPVPGGAALSAFHTFPDEYTVLKTQTLIEPAGG